MPFWKDLSGARQLLSDAAPLTVNKIFADQDVARIHNDGNAWSVNHLGSAGVPTRSNVCGIFAAKERHDTERGS